MSNFFNALLSTVGNVALAAAPLAQKSAGKKVKKGPGCTPCAVAARVADAQARAGLKTAP